MFTSTLVVVPSKVDPDALRGLLTSLAPEARVGVVVKADELSWLSSLAERAAVLERAEGALRGALPEAVRIEAFMEDDLPALRALLEARRPEVVVLGPDVPGAVALGQLALSLAVPVVWVPVVRPASFRRIAVPFAAGTAGVVPAAVWLRARVTPEQHVKLVQIGLEDGQPILASDEARQLLDWEGPLDVDRLAPRLAQPLTDLQSYLSEAQVDLLVVESMGISGLTMALVKESTRGVRAEQAWSVLFLPGTTQAGLLDPSLDAPDLIGEHPLLGFVQLADAFGVAHRFEAKELGLFAHGASRGNVRTDRGRFVLTAGAAAPTLGLTRPKSARVETVIRVLEPPARPVILVDASVTAAQLDELHVDAAESERWAVRLSHHQTFNSLRERLGRARVSAVLDAGVVLDDGHPDDLPDFATQVRLERVARRLETLGVIVPALVVMQDGAATLRTREPRTGRDELEILTGAAPDSLDTFDFNIDNREARTRFLSMVDGARHVIHLQAYIYEADELGREFAEHLVAAAKRGVQVRILIDSLLSKHLSLGLHNPVLEALSKQDAITVRAVRPIPGVPDLTDLKQRDHRKALIVDRNRALIGGRNVGKPYYTGFDEVALNPSTAAPDVPWIDAGAAVSGSCVRQLEIGFNEAWQAAGGEALPIPEPTPPGPIAARVVSHRGLVDANSVDAYRAVFDAATERILVVNTFPMQFELRESLMRACRRGVEVEYLVGNPRPYHGEHRFFEGWLARALATKIVFGRLDDLAAAGAKVYEAGYPRSEGWSEEIEALYPHVHAKLAICDGRRLLIGSANVDITAGYWENEASLLIEDEGVVTSTEAEVRALLRHARPLSTEEEIGPRRWLSLHWPSFLG
ncbi:MAG: phosphatidylserine/phosphatidylglycerophosphate/cardiolipin synthase family protein [Deltaproteobacteria bacterium]|nr:phosphatidylserine/phosphatidylglycerophosphate/cardiolipin synthase family protein [Deltaproteobacteria bacterium]